MGFVVEMDKDTDYNIKFYSSQNSTGPATTRVKGTWTVKGYFRRKK